MSFFHEPPPLDCDIPPPLDDKLRENDFDLDEEEIVIEEHFRHLELELPTDFNVFSSLATDEDLSYTHPPPKLPDFVLETSPPPDDPNVGEQVRVKSESPETTCDVAKEKESKSRDEVVSLHQIDRIAGDGEEHLSDDVQEDSELSAAQWSIENEEKTFNNTAVDDVIFPPDDDMIVHDNSQSNEDLEVNTVLNHPITSDKDDDDDFNDFVEADPGDVKLDTSDAFKTETLQLGSESEFVKLTGFTVQFDTPEIIPELNLDEDDDDFNDFETAIPVNRQVEQVRPTEQNEVPEEFVAFEADFSAFNAFSEPTGNGSFDEFQGFASASKDEAAEKQESQLQDDDDDFGDFSDFTQASASISLPSAQQEMPAVAFMKPANVNGILDMMFAPSSSCSIEKPEFDCDYAKDKQIIKSDNFVNKFNDFDSTLALGYLYSNSKASQTLVKSLGIDTRNILLGPQWSSSATSNMPRFAANLSFNPIEPMKPSASTSLSVKSSTEPKPSLLQPTKLPTETVPEAEFDWNSAGLVNPLDGPQPKPEQPHDVEPIVVKQPAAPPAHPLEDESSLYVVDQEITQVFASEVQANAGNKSELSEASTYQWSSETGSQHHVGHFGAPPASSNILVRERTIKLPETHIFTPVKGSSPVAREVTSRDVSPAPDDPYFGKGAIVVKEYHDVEYSLEPKKRIESDGDFDDFQSAQPMTDPPLVPLSLLEPQKIENSLQQIKWPEPGNVEQSVVNELDFLETTSAPAPPKINFNLALAPTTASTVVLKKKEQEFLKPVIGTSPTEQNGSVVDDDDDFNDFQVAPPRQQPKTAPSNDPITLSPARLISNIAMHSSQKSAWISSLDDDEISRIEAAFPKCKTEKKSSQKSNNDDDDDWSDFVGATAHAPPTSLPYSSEQKPPSMISSNKMASPNKPSSNGDTDDWSDFVSVPPPVAKIPSSRSTGALSSQLQSKPNFASWNQPSTKPYVNHHTSFLTNNSSSQQFTSSNYPYVTDKVPRQSITITNNFGYFPNPELNHKTGTPGNHLHQRPNGISTILPELDFAMPKHLINLPRGGSLDPGKK